MVKFSTLRHALVCLALTASLSASMELHATAMSESVYRALEGIRDQVSQTHYQEAHTELKKLLKDNSRLSSYERAQIWNLTGYTFYLQDNYPQAVTAYKEVLKQEDLPEALRLSTGRTLAQLWFSTGKYKEALEQAKAITANQKTQDTSLNVLMAHCLYQLKDYKESAKVIQLTIKASDKPKEGWYQLLRANYQTLEDFPAVEKVLEEMVTHFPKKEYLLALSAIYSQLEKPKKQLVLLEGVFESGQLDSEPHLKALGTLLLQQNLPIKSAQVLSQSLKAGYMEPSLDNLRLLAQAWLQAREDEKALDTLDKAAALDSSGKSSLLIAQLHLRSQQWTQAERALKTALSKELNDQPTAQLMLGMAQYNQKKYQDALISLKAASNHKKTRTSAQQWLDYTKMEIERNMEKL
ncbi:MAG: tetratricopeptide repeat protein [Endozoicomonas sp.]|uniref:tetratricopeptide repeat protein n=1 Tax=Endozoicomonas sp. TaxID=1892382 RepID=UPI003D9ADD3D